MLSKPFLHNVNLFLESREELSFFIDRYLLDYLPEYLIPRLEEVLLIDAEISLPEMLLRHTLALIGIKRCVIVGWTILDPVAALSASVADVVWGWLTRLWTHTSSLNATAPTITPDCATTLALRSLLAHLVQVLLRVLSMNADDVIHRVPLRLSLSGGQSLLCLHRCSWRRHGEVLAGQGLC